MRIFILISALVFTLTTLTSCSSKKSSDKGNTLYWAFSAEPSTLNPINSSDYYATLSQQYVVEGLLELDKETYEFNPGLAESYIVSEDGKKFTFKLREGVKFTNGEELTAEDVKFTFDAIKDPKYEAAQKLAYYKNINSPKVIDKYNIEFTSSDKYFGNLEVLATTSIVPKSVYKAQSKTNKLSKLLIGTGPYKLAKYNKGKSLIYKKNKEWWGFKLADKNYSERHKFDKIVIRFIKEDTVRLENLKKGNLNYDYRLNPESFVKKIDTKLPEWSHIVKVEPENDEPKSTSFIAWNLKNPIFQSKNTRIALAHMFNRKLIDEKFRYNKSYFATGPWYYQSAYADKSIKPIEFDVEKAKALLKSDGWADTDKDGTLDKKIDGKQKSFSFTILNPNRDNEKYYTVYKEDLKKVGIALEIKNIDWNSFVKALDEKKFDAVTMAWAGGSVHMNPKQIWHSESSMEGGSNFISYKNPKVDKLIDEAIVTLSMKDRIPMYQVIYKEIAEDAPYLFMFVERPMYAVDKNIIREKDTYRYTVGADYWTFKSKKAE